jgi:hypothetical protein
MKSRTLSIVTVVLFATCVSAVVGHAADAVAACLCARRIQNLLESQHRNAWLDNGKEHESGLCGAAVKSPVSHAGYEEQYG